ncbi:MAG TPA: NADAR family protein [Bryobacteraceae bacterium]|nr:NADAR family protein [Bryobacteraceae bacterium]
MDEGLPPLNVASVSDEEIGRDMSNFADTPFYYGKKPIRYHSVESFYQMLTHPDEKTRKTIAKMPGKHAKTAGKSGTTETAFEGKTYVLGSPEHHSLMEDVIRAKLEQNPGLARRFVATRPRPIVHVVPGHDSKRFPGSVFCRILTALREEFFSKQQGSR